ANARSAGMSAALLAPSTTNFASQNVQEKAITAVRAFAPGSVGNIGVGFDLLGHSIAGVRDIATVGRMDEPAVRVRSIRGSSPAADTLPLEAGRNTAGQALIALRERLGLGHGFEIELE